MEKTGKFKLSFWLGPEISEDNKRSALITLLHQLAHQLEISMQDGRAYELVAKFFDWAPIIDDGWPMGYQRKCVEYTLVLLNVCEVRIGEWVKNLPHCVSDGVERFAFGDGTGEMEGRVFERDEFGWKRVE